MTPVKGALTALFLGAASATTASAQGAQNNTATTNALADAICDAAKNHKYILIGDSNHASSEIQNAFFNDAVLTQIKNCLPSNAFVFEQPPSQLQYVEDELADIEKRKQDIEENREKLAKLEAEYAEIQASPERQAEINERIENSFLSNIYKDYTDYYEESINSIRLRIILGNRILNMTAPIITRMGMMKDHGLTLNFYDPGYNLAAEDMAILDMLQNAYVEEPACMNLTRLFSFAKHAKNPGQANARMWELLKNRDKDDPIIASNILKNHPDGAIIFYGSGHMNGKHDLDELLGDDDSFWISIEENYSGVNSEGVRDILKLMPSWWQYNSENADMIFDLTTDTMFPPTRAPDDYGQYKKLSQAEFDTCLNTMPQSLRDGFTKDGGPNFTFDDYRWLMNEERQGLPPILQSWVTPQQP